MLFVSKAFLAISPVVAMVLLIATSPLMMTMMSSTNPVFVNSNNAYAQANPGNLPSYFIEINSGGFNPESPSEYNIRNAAVPIDTTVEWINHDQSAQHTVTSGTPGNSTGFFDSGALPFNGNFQLSFNSATGLIGNFPYYCTLHPWITAKISANDTVERGQSFEFRSGTGPTLDLAKNNRTLLAFTPIGMSVNQGGVMFYNFSIIRDSDNKTMFSNLFDVESNDFEIELIQFPNISQFFPTAQNNSTWFGPDVSIDYTGAYHAAGDFFSQPGNYTLAVELTKIGSNPPPQQMKDEFSLSVVS